MTAAPTSNIVRIFADGPRVANPRHRGRYPKHITPLWKARNGCKRPGCLVRRISTGELLRLVSNKWILDSHGMYCQQVRTLGLLPSVEELLGRQLLVPFDDLRVVSDREVRQPGNSAGGAA